MTHRGRTQSGRAPPRPYRGRDPLSDRLEAMRGGSMMETVGAMEEILAEAERVAERRILAAEALARLWSTGDG